ncbi:uncharacterized protein LOC128397733 [Panonychus citri]|uniref:uncharacterized protein LOC128397733 n=1 Tax=Panonychus citri TaxID=50023 RepID=UPI002307E704|nr:uncharacterized protein LOC128397733 [Panonychus citri]
MYVQYINTFRPSFFELRGEVMRHMIPGSHRWAPISDNISLTAVAFRLGVNLPSVPTRFVELFYFVTFSEPITYVYGTFSPLEPTVHSFHVIHSFRFREYIYSFGSITFTNRMSVYFISRVSRIRVENGVSYYKYEELHSIYFSGRYDRVDKVRFANSFSLMRNENSYSFLAISLHAVDEAETRIFLIPFNRIIDTFQRPIYDCYTTRNFWTALVFNASYPDCFNVSLRPEIEISMLRYDFVGLYLENIITRYWTRILDFIPLALDATPGYVFLVLSAGNRSTRYRYSIHFVDENYSVSTHTYERTFNLRSRINLQLSQIYYYGFTHPRVIITLNRYTYTESIILCPFLNDSCIDCFTTRIYHQNSDSFRYCQWTPGRSFLSGQCSTVDQNSPNSRVIRPTGHTENPCFHVTNVLINNDPDAQNFRMDLDLLGFHSTYAYIFPLTFTLVDNTTYSVVENCSVIKYNQSMISLNCSQVHSGHYRLSIVMIRRRGPYNIRNDDNLITYSESFTISSSKPNPSDDQLIILQVSAFIVSMITLVVFIIVAKKAWNTLDKTRNLSAKSWLSAKYKSLLTSRSKSSPDTTTYSLELNTSKNDSFDQVPVKYFKPKIKTRIRDESIKTKPKR